MSAAITPPDAPVAPAALAAGLASGAFGDLPQRGSAAVALPRLIEALGWRGTIREFAAAVPHVQPIDATALFDVLARLGFPARRWRGRPGRLDRRLLPAVLVDGDGDVSIVTAWQGDRLLVHPAEGPVRAMLPSALHGVLHVFPAAVRQPRAAPPSSFSGGIARRLRPTLLLVIGSSCAIDTLALLSAFAVMAVYDMVIPARALDTLTAIALAVGFAAMAEVGLRAARARAIAHLSARVDVLVGRSVFARLLSFPLEMTANVPVGSQIARLGQFDDLRNIFTGPLGNALLELPFLVVFAVALLALTGPLALIPLGLIAAYAVLGALLLPHLRRCAEAASHAASERQDLLLETLTKMRAIRAAGCTGPWRERLRDSSARAGMAQRRAAEAVATLQTLTAALVPLCGVATIAIGTILVLDGAMSAGALVAAMMLVWRVLSPIQNGFHALTRLSETMNTVRQLDTFMRLKTEATGHAGSAALRPSLGGTIRFADVSFRYPGASSPALLGASFTVPQGALVAVTGRAGSGKTTLLRLALGLYQPQGGAVLIDGANLRNLPLATLRGVIGQVSDSPALFHGTLAQNLRLANQAASDRALEAVCEVVGIDRQIAALPNGLATRITDFGKDQLPAGLRQGIALAQALLRQPRLLLLDEPARGLDTTAEAAFLAAVRYLRGHATILMVTHRPSHMASSDLVLALDGGRVTGFGPPAEILARKQGTAHAA